MSRAGIPLPSRWCMPGMRGWLRCGVRRVWSLSGDWTRRLLRRGFRSLRSPRVDERCSGGLSCWGDGVKNKGMCVCFRLWIQPWSDQDVSRRRIYGRWWMSKSKKPQTEVWGFLESGAGNESRTRDLNLGKVALYQLSYSRVFSYSAKPCIVGCIFMSVKSSVESQDFSNRAATLLRAAVANTQSSKRQNYKARNRSLSNHLRTV